LVPSTPSGGSPSIIGTRQGSGMRQIGREGGAAAGRPAASLGRGHTRTGR